ncbi:MAG: alanine--tRNA ligase [Polyangiaceae bacterium]|nr:alanine--tRNA ligase [Polyangiaceae bacterium]
MKASEIRRSFLEFFASEGHTVCPSGPIVPNDPSLLFANAGMVPFKDVFTGKESKPFRRAASSQKCVRISGKHNDLENVGRTARHHTFFEMLGNFSFGDYFKEEAIAFAWKLVTQVFQLPQDRLVITVFGGEGDLPPDDEARALWKKVAGLGDDRILGLGKADNFWQMGETGPCGPCSELHYWLGPVPPEGVPYGRFGEEPTAQGEGWFEFWNLVFMQYERLKRDDDSFELRALPAPSIDTGMGLERMASLLQGVTSNYDTDLLRPLVERAASLSGKAYGGSMGDDDVSMRVIADHARMATFSLAEGVSPDRTGRGYVLRRVMRRAVRHGHRLGIARPFFHEVAGLVVDLMGADYPELLARREFIVTQCEQEEVQFRRTLDRGLGLLDEQFELLSSRGEKQLAGPAAFKLYDTYGFPVDLTEIIAAERGFGVDREGFEAEVKLERERAQKRGGSVLNRDEGVGALYYQALGKVPGGEVAFSGYDAEEGEGRVVAIIADGAFVDEVAWAGGTGPLPEVEIITDATPFYGRGGGQVGDEGELRAIEGTGRVVVRDTLKPTTGLVVHQGFLAQGRLAVGDQVRLEVDHDKRSATRRNHSATHLLHWALGAVLGSHVEQKGSLVGPDVLRFDFSHSKPLTQGEIERVEDLVNEKILGNEPILTEVLPVAEARAKGAKAIFEEKYGDVVRVLTMTSDSVELCGGTHARALGDLGLFKIVSETGVAAGVRRVEAATGLNALTHVREQDKLLRDIAHALKAPGPRPRLELVAGLTERVRELEKAKTDLTRKLAMGGGGGAASGGGGGVDAMIAAARDFGGVKALAVESEVGDAATLRELADRLRDKLGDAVVLVGSKASGKASLVLTVSKSLIGRFKAGELIGPIAAHVGGKGGGRPDMAQAGGPDAAKLTEALPLLYDQLAASAGAPATA